MYYKTHLTLYMLSVYGPISLVWSQTAIKLQLQTWLSPREGTYFSLAFRQMFKYVTNKHHVVSKYRFRSSDAKMVILHISVPYY